jgi:hypothetical protein
MVVDQSGVPAGASFAVKSGGSPIGFYANRRVLERLRAMRARARASMPDRVFARN